ncbi:hypothetical protein J6590_007465 [Homalodisca vitripennis]|nr:hypothetical protein J6590_007465 [Homalodisca vitripennis]
MNSSSIHIQHRLVGAKRTIRINGCGKCWSILGSIARRPYLRPFVPLAQIRLPHNVLLWGRGGADLYRIDTATGREGDRGDGRFLISCRNRVRINFPNELTASEALPEVGNTRLEEIDSTRRAGTSSKKRGCTHVTKHKNSRNVTELIWVMLRRGRGHVLCLSVLPSSSPLIINPVMWRWGRDLGPRTAVGVPNAIVSDLLCVTLPECLTAGCIEKALNFPPNYF